MQEAHWMDLYTNGSLSMPEAFWGVNGKPDAAGGPMRMTWYNSWKPVHAGGHIVYIRETRFNGTYDGTATASHMENVK